MRCSRQARLLNSSTVPLDRQLCGCDRRQQRATGLRLSASHHVGERVQRPEALDIFFAQPGGVTVGVHIHRQDRARGFALNPQARADVAASGASRRRPNSWLAKRGRPPVAHCPSAHAPYPVRLGDRRLVDEHRHSRGGKMKAPTARFQVTASSRCGKWPLPLNSIVCAPLMVDAIRAAAAAPVL